MNRTLASALLALAALAGCNPTLPPRYVVESDFDSYAYRRFQKVLDIEFPVADNPAEGYTAVYVAEERNRFEAVTAFVTVYDHAASLTAEIRDRLGDLGTYELAVERMHGEYVWTLQGHEDERWILWVSGRHLIKLGAMTREVPEPVIRRYLHLYDSDLGEDGRAREGRPSAGPSARQREETEALQMPSSLREGAPR